MAKLSRQVGTTSERLLVFVQDSTSATGAGKTGILFNAAGLTCYYKTNAGTASISVSLVTITTLGTYVSGGWKEVDATNMPGVYEFHPPNAALASGADSVVFYFQGAAGMVPLPLEIELTATTNQTDIRITKNLAANAFPIYMVSSTDHITPVTGATVTAQRSIDGGAFASCANSVTELSNGVYLLNLAASDVNGNIITFLFTATGADPRLVTVFTQQ